MFKKLSIISLILVLIVSVFAVVAPTTSEATNRGGLFQRQGLFQQRNRVQNVRVQKVVAPVHVQRVQVQRVNKFVPVQQFNHVQRVQNFGHHHVQQFRVIEQIPVRTTRIVEVPGFNRVQKLNVVRDHYGRILNVEKVQVQQFNQNLKRSRLQGNKIIIQQNLRY